MLVLVALPGFQHPVHILALFLPVTNVRVGNGGWAAPLLPLVVTSPDGSARGAVLDVSTDRQALEIQSIN